MSPCIAFETVIPAKQEAVLKSILLRNRRSNSLLPEVALKLCKTLFRMIQRHSCLQAGEALS